MGEALSSLTTNGVPQLLCALAILTLGMVAVVREGASGRLAGGVAHDFNNLLTIIRGNTHLVLEEPSVPDDGSVRAAVAEIDAASERAARLTSQLLAFSRRQVLRPVIVDPGAAIRDMEPMLRRLIRADIEIDILLDERIGNIRVDPGQ